MTHRVIRSGALVLGFLLVSSLARAQAVPEWSALAAEDVVQVVTHDVDGEVRDTSVWLAVVDGQGYVRTGATRWRANLERDPDFVFRIAGKEFPLRAQRVTDAPTIARINDNFRAKYGFSDRVVGWFENEESGYYFAPVARPPAP